MVDKGYTRVEHIMTNKNRENHMPNVWVWVIADPKTDG